MAWEDIYIRNSDGFLTNNIKPEYPRTFLRYVTGSNGDRLEVYGVNISKDVKIVVNPSGSECDESRRVSMMEGTPLIIST